MKAKKLLKVLALFCVIYHAAEVLGTTAVIMISSHKRGESSIARSKSYWSKYWAYYIAAGKAFFTQDGVDAITRNTKATKFALEIQDIIAPFMCDEFFSCSRMTKVGEDEVPNEIKEAAASDDGDDEEEDKEDDEDQKWKDWKKSFNADYPYNNGTV